MVHGIKVLYIEKSPLLKVFIGYSLNIYLVYSFRLVWYDKRSLKYLIQLGDLAVSTSFYL